MELKDLDIKNIIADLIYRNNKSKFIFNKIISLANVNNFNEKESKYTIIGVNRLKFLLNLEKKIFLIKDISVKAVNFLKQK